MAVTGGGAVGFAALWRTAAIALEPFRGRIAATEGPGTGSQGDAHSAIAHEVRVNRNAVEIDEDLFGDESLCRAVRSCHEQEDRRRGGGVIGGGRPSLGEVSPSVNEGGRFHFKAPVEFRSSTEGQFFCHCYQTEARSRFPVSMQQSAVWYRARRIRISGFA
jgi:hypothetical protein